MASLLEKISTLVSANMHSLIDKALQSNSTAVIDQYIRNVESNLAELEDAASTVGGEVKSINRRLLEQQAKSSELDRAIDAFLKNGSESAAIAAQSQLNSTIKLVETYQAQAKQQEAEYRSLLDAKVKLEARLATMKQEREQLQALLDLAKSKETTVKAMKSLDDLMGSGDSDIKRIADGIYSRLDKANTASEMRTASLDQQMDDVLNRSSIDNQLAERKKKLGLAQ